jgi:hypothetical protein
MDAIANYLADRLSAQVSSGFAATEIPIAIGSRHSLGQSAITPDAEMIAGLGVSKKRAAGSFEANVHYHSLHALASRKRARYGPGRLD